MHCFKNLRQADISYNKWITFICTKIFSILYILSLSKNALSNTLKESQWISTLNFIFFFFYMLIFYNLTSEKKCYVRNLYEYIIQIKDFWRFLEFKKEVTLFEKRINASKLFNICNSVRRKELWGKSQTSHFKELILWNKCWFLFNIKVQNFIFGIRELVY